MPLTRSAPATPQLLEGEELTILTAWAEGISEVVAYAPENLNALLAQAQAGASWRAPLGAAELSSPLSAAIESLSRLAATVGPDSAPSPFDGLLNNASQAPPDETALDRLTRLVLLAMLEERQTRQRR
jgi:hypothetical protein